MSHPGTFIWCNEAHTRKALISEFFREGAATQGSEAELTPSPQRHSPCNSAADDGDDRSIGCNSPGGELLGGEAKEGQSERNILLLTPSVAPPRPAIGGATQREDELLHEKHQAEYDIIVPIIGRALQCAVESHEARMPEAALASAAAGEGDGVGGAAANKVEPCMKVFDEAEMSPASLPQQLCNLVWCTFLSPSVLVAACLYLDRLLRLRPELHLTKHNIWMLFLTAARIANKVLDTRTLSSKDYAAACGVTNRKLGKMEYVFVMELKFDMYISSVEFEEYVARLRGPNRSDR